MSYRDKEHAVVIGASVAGLLAARVLSEHFDKPERALMEASY